MTGASSLAFPGSRTLAGWWRQLAAHQPQSLWVGYLFLHHVEALAAVNRLQAIDRFSHLVLQAVALEAVRLPDNAGGQRSVLARLEDRLHLGRQLLVQVLRGLSADGLISSPQADTWTLTQLGQQTLPRGEYPRDCWERRLFSFVERADAAGTRLPPHFLNVSPGSGVPWHPEEEGRFDTELLRDCMSRPETWKRQLAFPLDVRNVVFAAPEAASTPEAGTPQPAPPAWQQVVVDRPERLLVALALVRGVDGQQQLLGFAGRQEGWFLHAAAPLFSLGPTWTSVFPALAADVPANVLTSAWHSWCETRGLDVEGESRCTLAGAKVRVGVPIATLSRWRAGRSDVWKGETWLLIGDDFLRAAALLDVTAQGD